MSRNVKSSKIAINAILTPAGTDVVFKWQESFHNVDQLGSADDYANCDGITNTSGAHIYLLEYPIPALLSCSSVTKSVTWRYLGPKWSTWVCPSEKIQFFLTPPKIDFLS